MTQDEWLAYAGEVVDHIQDYIWKNLTLSQPQREELADMFVDLTAALSEARE